MLSQDVWEPWPPQLVRPPPWKLDIAGANFTEFDDDPFGNYDCVNLASPVVDWDALRNNLRTECGHTRETGTLQCAARVKLWKENMLPYLQMNQPWAMSSELDFEAFERVEAAAYSECPLGVLMLNIAKTLLCAEAHSGCYLRYTAWVSRELYNTRLTVMMGTDWPIFALLNSYDWSWPGIPRGQDYDCTRSNQSTLSWPELLDIFSTDAQKPRKSWWLDSLRFVFDGKMSLSQYTASYECLYGLYVCNMVKAFWASDTESSTYYTYAPYISWILYESLHLLGASRWPVFALLHHFSSLRRHGFRLDFSAKELGGLPFREQGAWLQSLPLERHAGLLDSLHDWRPHLAATGMALQSALRGSGEGLRLAYVTMVYGRMNRFIAGWARRAKRLGMRNLVMVTLDPEAYALCIEHHGQQCVSGSISVHNKYTVLLVALQMGIDVMWLDFDIFLIRNPDVALAEAAAEGDYDILMGYDFMSDCVCNGFFYLRARPTAFRWLFELVRWLYTHPYEHDQRAISALLNYTERISLDPESLPPVPRWNALEADNTFINWGPWEGRFEDLVFVHFVDGSAFSLYGRPDWDASIPQSKRDALAGVEGRPQSPMEAFYASDAVDADPDAVWEVAPELKAMMDSHVRPPPPKKQACGILPDVKGAHSGYGWLMERPPTKK